MDSAQPDAADSLQTSMLTFRVISNRPSGSRLGQLICRGGRAIDTPHFVATTSRGVVPHLSPDVLQRHTSISAVYLSLEDCGSAFVLSYFTLTDAYSGRPVIEKRLEKAPILKTPIEPGESRLCKYVASADEHLTIMGPRRVPPLQAPTHNSTLGITICTSVGFSQIAADDYHNAVQSLAPDILVTMADVITTGTASVKRIEKSADRTHAWFQDAVQESGALRSVSDSTAIFAAIPPVDNVQQSLYLQDLAEDYRELLSGLAVHSATSVLDLPHQLRALPRLCLSNPDSPHTILNDINLGIDLLTLPFCAASSDHGIALAFDFPGPISEIDEPVPLGLDLWSTEHQTSLQPLSPGCNCFTCTRHHRAYIHHLLQVKEMLAWTLLQIHNHAVLDRFFEAVRQVIREGSFEEDRSTFNRAYVQDLPASTGAGPRVRGYQTKSKGGGEDKKNAKSWGRLDDAAEKIAEAKSGIATPDGDSEQLQQQGFAKKA